MRNLFGNTKLAIAAVVLFTTSILILLWYKQARLIHQEKEEAIANAVQRNSNLALALENYTIRTIQNAELVLQVIKSELEKSRTGNSNLSVFENPSIDNSLFYGVLIINEKGKLVSSSYRPIPDTTVNYSQQDFFKFHFEDTSENLFIGKPVHLYPQGDATVTVSRRINNAGEKFGGMALLQIAPSTFTSFYEKAIVNDHDIVSLIAPDGTTYARQTGSVPSSGENISKSPLFSYLKLNSTGSYFAEDAIHGIPTYFSYRRLKNYPIIATVGVAEMNVLAAYEKRKRHEIIFTSGITLIIVLFSLLASIGILNRKKYISLLQENEEKYRLMFENTRDAILLLRLDGEVIDMNAAARQLFKIADRQKKPSNFLDFSGGEQLPSVNDHTGVNEEFINTEIQFTCADGSTFTGEISSASYYSTKEKNNVNLAVIRDTTERKRLQQELLKEKTSRQQLVTKQVIQAQEKERSIIGGELHDNVCQILSTVKIYLSLVIKNQERGAEFLPKSMEFLDLAILEIRNLSHTLSAPTLGKKSLLNAINELLTDVSSHSSISVHFNSNTEAEEIDVEQKLAVFRIVQEQVNNILKHANASEIFISLNKNTGGTKLLIKDNGVGFNPKEKSKGIGLDNIETRAQAFDGSVQIITSPGNGCSVKVHFPASHSANADRIV